MLVSLAIQVHLFLAHIHHTVRLFITAESYGKAPFLDNIVHINNAVRGSAILPLLPILLARLLQKDGATRLKDADFIMRVTVGDLACTALSRAANSMHPLECG